MSHRGGHARAVVGPDDATGRWLGAIGQGRIVGLDEDHAIGPDLGQHVGWVADAGRDDDPVGAVLGERRQGPLFAFLVVQAGHDEDRVSLAGGRLLEARRDLGVDRVGEVVEQDPQDVGALRPQAAGRGIGDVAELRGGGMDGRSGRLADPGIVLEGARRRRLGGLGEPGDIREDDPTFRGSAHPARLRRPGGRRDHDHVHPGLLAGRCSAGTH